MPGAACDFDSNCCTIATPQRATAVCAGGIQTASVRQSRRSLNFTLFYLRPVMRSTTYRFLFAAALALTLFVVSQPATLSQQKPQPTPDGQDQQGKEVITIREVRLPVTVIGKDKQPV